MPRLLTFLSLIGTAAMLWVGGGIFSHGLAEFGRGVVPHTIEHWGHAAGEAVRLGKGAVAWLVEALGSAGVGLVVGGIVVAVMHLIPRKKAAAAVTNVRLRSRAGQGSSGELPSPLGRGSRW